MWYVFIHWRFELWDFFFFSFFFYMCTLLYILDYKTHSIDLNISHYFACDFYTEEPCVSMNQKSLSVSCSKRRSIPGSGWLTAILHRLFFGFRIILAHATLYDMELKVKKSQYNEVLLHEKWWPECPSKMSLVDKRKRSAYDASFKLIDFGSPLCSERCKLEVKNRRLQRRSF